jgi:hypothetical protein
MKHPNNGRLCEYLGCLRTMANAFSPPTARWPGASLRRQFAKDAQVVFVDA